MEKPKLRPLWLTLLCGLVSLTSPAAENAADEEFSPETNPAKQSKSAQEAEDQEAAKDGYFRVTGAEAIEVARAAGYCFSPRNGKPPRDGQHTTASQFADAITSVVDGVKMTQFQPPTGWNVAKISNTFYMFVDSRLRPVALAPGWTIRGIQLQGPAWKWVGRPAAGAPSASFAITIIGHKGAAAATTVELKSISLQGPPGAKDWRAAFAELPKPRGSSR